MLRRSKRVPADNQRELAATLSPFRSLAATIGEPNDPNDPFTPPLDFEKLIGEGNFHVTGSHLAQLITTLTQMTPNARVLDIGSGIGRTAVGLSGYLSRKARYEGFDVVEENVAWCTERITSRYPRFHFRHANLHNAFYNPQGTMQGDTYRFPFRDKTFDVVFLTSTFTHLLLPDMTHYLSEIARVLRPGGRCLATYFLLTDETRTRIMQGESPIPFLGVGPMMTISTAMPEHGLAFDESLVRRLHRQHELRILEPIHRGIWTGIDAGLTFQDVVVAVKH